MIKLYNTLSRTVEPFEPIYRTEATLYTCGPTVYDFAHIGNLRTYIFEDILRRVLEYNGFEVTHAMNITDVGHLVGDGDEGEDKMDKGAKREGKHPLEIARIYETQFFKDLALLNIKQAHHILRATESIEEQIEIIRLLEAKGYTYKDEFAVYFDTSKLSDYGKLAGQKLEDKKVGAREDVVVDIKKKNPQDFVLWFFLAGRYKDHILQWDSPWGKGFPGWHIECSAISRKLLGQPFDIHTGGVDHIGTHHTNEIAQSEAAFNMPLANFWLHGEFLLIAAGRMGKSEGNAYNLKTVLEKNFRPLDYRYFVLGAHYRTQLNFTWEALEAARSALNRLYAFMRNVIPANGPQSRTENRTPGIAPSNTSTDRQVLHDTETYEQKFLDAINDDLNAPKALGIMWELIGDKSISDETKKATVLKFDTIFGLGLDNPPEQEAADIPEAIKKLAEERDEARKNKDYAKSDELRAQIETQGFEVLDTASGTTVQKK